MSAIARPTPSGTPEFDRMLRRVSHVNGRPHEPETPVRRVRAGAPAAAEPQTDAERDRLLADSELFDKVRQATEVKRAYQRGHREGERRGLQAIKRSWFWSGVGFGTCIGCLLVFTMLGLGPGL